MDWGYFYPPVAGIRVNGDKRLSMLSVGSRRKSGNEYPDDRTATDSVGRRKLAAMMSWYDHLTTVG